MKHEKNEKFPSYSKHKTSGRARVIINGRHVYLPGLYGSAESRRSYDRLIGEYLAGGRTLRGDPEPATVAEVINGYRVHCQSHYKANDGELSREVENIRNALKPLARAYGDIAAAEFSPICLESLRKKMIGLGWSRSYINAAVGRLRRCWKWAASRELIPVTAWQALQTVDGLRYGRSGARETEPVRPVSQHDIDATLPFLNRHVRAMVQVQLLSGSRGGEICQMTAGQIDMTRPVWEYKPLKHKTAIHGHVRIIYLGPKAQERCDLF